MDPCGRSVKLASTMLRGGVLRVLAGFTYRPNKRLTFVLCSVATISRTHRDQKTNMHRTAPHCTARYGTARHGTVRHYNSECCAFPGTSRTVFSSITHGIIRQYYAAITWALYGVRLTCPCCVPCCLWPRPEFALCYLCWKPLWNISIHRVTRIT